MNDQHLLEREVIEYVAGVLQTGTRLGIEAHVAGCTECRDQILAEALHLCVGRRIRRLLFEEEPALQQCAVS